MLCKHACGLGARDELLRRMGQVPVLGALCPALCVFNRARCVGLLRAAVTCVMQWNCGQDHHAVLRSAQRGDGDGDAGGAGNLSQLRLVSQ